LYVEGYSYLNGFRINANDGTRSLYKTAAGGTLGFATAGADPITFTQSASTERMRIDSSGNVGIGTSSPNQKLSVSGGRSYFGANSEAYAIGVGYNGTRTAANQTYFIGATDAAAPDLQFSNSDGGEKVRITHSGNVGIGTSSPAYKLSVSGNIGLTDGVSTATHALVGGNYYMQNTGAYSTIFQTAGTERMRITSAGSVGIGTSSPSSKLHISDANTSIIKASVDAGGSGVGSFRASHGTNEFGFYVAGTNALVFYDYGSNNERMRIDSAGRIGIGTSSPINSLHIQDSINQKMIITNDDFVDGTTGTSFDITFGATSGNTYSEIRHLINGRGAWGNFVLARNGGNVGIGLTVPTEKLHVSGNILATGNITAYSDERLKSDIETLDGSKVYEMRGVSYIKDGQASSGVIAQELQKVAPELVSESGEYLSVAYGNLVGYLIEAVKELKAEIEELKNASSD
jgi:hypothetical protein